MDESKPKSTFFSKIENFQKTFNTTLVTIVIIYFIYSISVISCTNSIVLENLKINASGAASVDSEFATLKLYNKIIQIRTLGKSYHSRDFNPLMLAESYDTQLALPDESLARYLKFIVSRAHQETRIKGLLDIDSNKTQLSISLTNNELFEARGTSLDSLLQAGAVFLLSKIDPVSLASYYLQRRDPACISIAEQMLLDKDPENDPIAYHLKGSTFLNQHKYPQAKVELLKAISLFKKEKLKTPSLNNLGVMYFEQIACEKDAAKKKAYADSAMSFYRQALAIDDSYYGTYMNMANLKRSSYDSVTQLLQECISLRPDFVQAISSLGFAYFEHQQKIKGLELLEHASQINPKHPMPYLFLAIAAIQNKVSKDSADVLIGKVKMLDLTFDHFYYSRLQLALSGKDECQANDVSPITQRKSP